MSFTGMVNLSDTVESSSFLETESPAFTDGVENGLVPAHKVRGKTGVV